MDKRDILRITFSLLSLACWVVDIFVYIDFKRKIKRLGRNLDTRILERQIHRIVTRWANISIIATIGAMLFGIIATLIMHGVI